jgi:transposase-like protein
VTASSREILLARPLLSSTQGDLTALLKEVKELLEELVVPVKGILSDGEETIRSAVAFVFPDVPHQLCQFHYLRDATKLLYEADRNAKTQLKKHLRGVRPIERAVEEYRTPENEAIRGWYSHWIWWIIRSAPANSFQASLLFTLLYR